MKKANSAQITIPFDKVDAHPTKKFFVEMLTRDIDLMDAIMDLVDNCIDGVHRQRKLKTHQKGGFYAGFESEITITPSAFTIKDNCGGIPEDVARNYAFKMGRDDGYNNDKNLETVGVYGIGMKRAIFKIGTEATVTSHHDKSIFKVSIPSNWPSINEWFFDFKKLEKKDIVTLLPVNGTLLKITGVHNNISSKFADKEGFLKDLSLKLQEHYGYIIQQGFTIKLNGKSIPALELNIISIEPTKGMKKSIKPFVFNGSIDDVNIEIIVGFYRPPADQIEIDEGLDGAFAKSTTENAGITVLCNDRVVLYGNKDHLTGWGESPVPSYHTQFINIAGVVHFRSKTPVKLPVTTTKRGLDTSSAIYSLARNKIREGLKIFTSFTNQWKAPSEERTKLFQGAKPINALIPGLTKSKFKLEKRKKGSNDEYYIPDLPKPSNEKKDKLVSISFSRDKIRIEEMRDYFFEGEDKSASEIGGWCFDELYSQIEK